MIRNIIIGAFVLGASYWVYDRLKTHTTLLLGVNPIIIVDIPDEVHGLGGETGFNAEYIKIATTSSTLTNSVFRINDRDLYESNPTEFYHTVDTEVKELAGNNLKFKCCHTVKYIHISDYNKFHINEGTGNPRADLVDHCEFDYKHGEE